MGSTSTMSCTPVALDRALRIDIAHGRASFGSGGLTRWRGRDGASSAAQGVNALRWCGCGCLCEATPSACATLRRWRRVGGPPPVLIDFGFGLVERRRGPAPRSRAGARRRTRGAGDWVLPLCPRGGGCLLRGTAAGPRRGCGPRGCGWARCGLQVHRAEWSQLKRKPPCGWRFCACAARAPGSSLPHGNRPNALGRRVGIPTGELESIRLK